MKQLNTKEQIKDLDEEIGELHEYISLLIDQKRNENSEWLNILATLLLPAGIITGLFGMNMFECPSNWWHFWVQFSIIVVFQLLFITSKKEEKLSYGKLDDNFKRGYQMGQYYRLHSLACLHHKKRMYHLCD